MSCILSLLLLDLILQVEYPVIILLNLLLQIHLLIVQHVLISRHTLHLLLDLLELPGVRFSLLSVAHVFLLILLEVLDSLGLKSELFLELLEG